MCGILLTAMPASAQTVPPVLADSFPVGRGAGGQCQAQSSGRDPAIRGMFDRAWTLVCRDAARPVGQIYALRDAGTDMDALNARIASPRGAAITCGGVGGVTLPDIGLTMTRQCTLADSALPYRLRVIRRGKVTYVAQGLAAYGNALDLALRSVVTNQLIDEKAEITSLGGTDTAAFARLQAATVDPYTALGQGYRRNASGDYTQAAEYFDTLIDRLATDPDETALSPAERAIRAHEYAINRALQLSNLSAFDQADALFAQAERIDMADRVQLRLRRNFLAMHEINRGDLARAIVILDRPTADPALELSDEGGLVVTPRAAGEMNGSLPTAKALGMVQATRLTPEERAAIIDAQAVQLRGTIQRLQGDPAGARTTLERALADAIAIREGRVVSIMRLRAQLLAEIALTHEAQGDHATAESLLREGLALIAIHYPETVAMNGAQARVASFLVRHGRKDEALALYRAIIASTVENQSLLTGLTNQLQPYFALLAAEIPARPELIEDLFTASQTLVRPGAADSLEQLSRSLAAGPGDASRLFRLSLSLGRDIERTRIAIAQASDQASRDPAAAAQIPGLQQALSALTTEQTQTLAALGAYPQYRAVSKSILSLADLRTTLQPGEAYMKLAQLSDGIYAVWVDGDGATGYRVPLSTADMAAKIAGLRATISTVENGARTTYALDVPLARGLFVDLFAPVDERLAKVRHLIFEPDGAMLQLPVNLLIASQPGADAYIARIARPGSDEFDFRGIDWLGRSRAVSTALSVRAFRDSRIASSSAAANAYLGLGENARPLLTRPAALTAPAPGTIDCNWPLAQWNSPVSSRELRTAASQFSAGQAQLLTGGSFTDTALLGRSDLDSFRILHFATHGLVTAPRPVCPARPALLTSFGAAGQSNGLLDFQEIFNLRLDADLVILSACDTAGAASASETRAAGLSGRGGALDGLVRAFIGAGGRSVIASHWPAPDEYRATERLMTGLFAAPRGASMGEALRRAQVVLMDQPETSHPFYWSGFALIGDGARPLIATQ
ncbi:CHAT domain-containing tetratricopeptide repeat protein [Sphingobium sp. AN641]|uniref:CHAT domain-containing protein n=1 Tax=Sphingobium sp. AN641 TaxID=3133443 RepID=UPI0030C15411